MRLFIRSATVVSAMMMSLAAVACGGSDPSAGAAAQTRGPGGGPRGGPGGSQIVAVETRAVENGRKTRPDLEVGICGEHGGEPSSVEFCYRVGMDYVSCSPYRVPIARLAAAQAAITGSDKSEAARTA